MKKSLIVASILLGFSFIASPSYADLSVDLDTIFSNTTSPAGSGPWVLLDFNDISVGSVQLVITSQLKSASEFITELDFNSSLVPLTIPLNGISVSGTVATPSISQGYDSYKADGDGFFDISLGFQTAAGQGRFQMGDQIMITFNGPGLTSSFFDSLSVNGGGQGVYTAAAHVQGILTGEGSTWIGDPGTPVPEPATMLLFGTGVAGFAAIARRKRS
ncbi:MAG: PEP-CTERM sorting domain-containing protein [Chlorobium sp.]|nr:PEP-CTERM sorting domain-containing protein [Chlorobium sp.]